MAECFGGAAGFGARPAVVVVDLNLGFTDPSSPLGVRSRRRARRTSRAARRGARGGRARLLHHDRLRRGGGGRGGGVPAQGPGAEGAAAGDAVGGDRPAARAAATTSRCSSRRTPRRSSACRSRRCSPGRDTLIVCGASTSGCVRATVVDAMQHGLVADRRRASASATARRARTSRRSTTSAAATATCSRRGGARGEVARALQRGPGSVAAQRAPDSHSATPISASRSMPVSTPSFVEQVDQVLGGDVARRARRERAAAEAADGRVEDRRAVLEPGVRRSRSRCCACCAGAGRRACRPRSARGSEVADLARHADADRVGQDHLVGARRRHPVRVLDHQARVDVALERAAERDADRRGRLAGRVRAR